MHNSPQRWLLTIYRQYFANGRNTSLLTRVQSLPPEIICKIFSYLQNSELDNFALCSVEAENIVQNVRRLALPGPAEQQRYVAYVCFSLYTDPFGIAGSCQAEMPVSFTTIQKQELRLAYLEWGTQKKSPVKLLQAKHEPLLARMARFYKLRTKIIGRFETQNIDFHFDGSFTLLKPTAEQQIVLDRIFPELQDDIEQMMRDALYAFSFYRPQLIRRHSCDFDRAPFQVLVTIMADILLSFIESDDTFQLLVVINWTFATLIYYYQTQFIFPASFYIRISRIMQNICLLAQNSAPETYLSGLRECYTALAMPVFCLGFLCRKSE